MEQQGTACFPAGLPESQSHSEHLTCPTRGWGGGGEREHSPVPHALWWQNRATIRCCLPGWPMWEGSLLP